MRRPRLISFLAALIAIGALVVSAGFSTASAAAPPIVCPLAAGPPITCCGPPISTPGAASFAPCCQQNPGGCCPGTVVCILPTTITSTPNPSVAGSAVTISGHVAAAGAGTAVALWQQLPGQKSFQQIAQTTTDSSGAYKLRRGGGKVKTDRAWYVAAGTAKSPTIEQVVTARVTVSARVAKLSSGHRITLTGKVDPSHTGQRVRLEQRVSGTWQVLGHARLSKKSRYAISHRWAHPGIVKLRIALPSDKRNAASFSRVTTVSLSG